ncbi:type II secretion system protein [Deefgea sp. CFH1-16]|uniref:type II secretion system protein n=1 Tax=Deefgea sp. CFH1-16 TaxID=2675457 RepID=UPI0015F59464|nr:type II secretion system protein [Deefgea sp. CFH1-16]MBM5573679.1 type II secretion system protein [Deefgea sp. CFH1-16]
MAPSTTLGKRVTTCRQQHRAQQGFAYVWALMLVLIMGIYLAQVGEAWQNRIQRSKEEELMRVGNEIRLAIKQYSEQNSAAGLQYPKTLQDLVQDPRVPFPRRYLRKAYKDPITGGDWLMIGGPGGGFMGVQSPSLQKPLKNDQFIQENASFKDAKSYQDWRFAHWPNQGGGRK